MAKPASQGQRFGQLTAQRLVVREDKRRRWECVCSCGAMKIIREDSLMSGRTVSCECAKIEKMRALGKRAITHGCAKRGKTTPEYKAWKAAIYRCTDPGNAAFASYGGRGIKVCERWLSNFPAFLADMGKRPLGTSLDRRDNNGPYSKKNCRWANKETQANNKRNSKAFEAFGQSMSLPQWARHVGIKRSTLSMRIYVYKWPIERALSERVRQDGHGQTMG